MTDTLSPHRRTREVLTTLPPNVTAQIARKFFDHWLNVAVLVILVLLLGFAFLGQYLTPWAVDEVDWNALEDVTVYGRPSFLTGHYFGVDPDGLDLFARLVVATRMSLAYALSVALIAVSAGALTGVIAGYFGGWVDAVLLAINEFAQSLPFIVLVILWQAYLGNSVLQTLFIIAVITWPKMFMLARGQAMILKNKDYVIAARIMGLSHRTIIFRHIVPNMIGILFIGFSLIIPNIVVIESLIAFLDLGPQLSENNWGSMLAEGVGNMFSYSLWQFTFPALIYAIAQTAFFYLAEGLRSAFELKELK